MLHACSVVAMSQTWVDFLVPKADHAPWNRLSAQRITTYIFLKVACNFFLFHLTIEYFQGKT